MAATRHMTEREIELARHAALMRARGCEPATCSVCGVRFWFKRVVRGERRRRPTLCQTHQESAALRVPPKQGGRKPLTARGRYERHFQLEEPMEPERISPVHASRFIDMLARG